MHELDPDLNRIKELSTKLTLHPFAELRYEQLNLLGKDDVPPQLDGKVSDKLDHIFARTRTFSKAWSIRKWNEVDGEQFPDVMPWFERDGAQRFASHRCMDAVRRRQIVPRFLLQAPVTFFYLRYYISPPIRTPARVGASTMPARLKTL